MSEVRAPRCPGCDRLPALQLGEGQAFCDNEDCRVFTWDPYLPARAARAVQGDRLDDQAGRPQLAGMTIERDAAQAERDDLSAVLARVKSLCDCGARLPSNSLNLPHRLSCVTHKVRSAIGRES